MSTFRVAFTRALQPAIALLFILLGLKSASSKIDGAACSKKWVQGVRAVEGHLVVGFKSKRHQIQPPRMHGFEIDSHADVLYIHVGKSGGGTIKESLDKMGVHYDEVHVWSVAPHVAFNPRYRAILISLRDPIDRLESAFEYHKNDQGHAKMRRVFEPILNCFPTLGDLLNECASTNRSDVSTECAKIADSAFSTIPLHLAYDTCFYLGGIGHMLPKNQVWVVQQESLNTDITAFHEYYFNRSVESQHIGCNKCSESQRNPSQLKKYRELFSGEYQLISAIMAGSINKQNNTYSI